MPNILYNKLRVMTYSVSEYYKNLVLKLKALYAQEEARAMADRLFYHYLNLSPAKRVLSANTLVEADRITLMDEALNKLLRNIPLQYVIGEASFMNLEFVVNSSVLIPRPETEEMVSLILKQYSDRMTGNKLNILDIGTGSGCIPIALKRYMPESNVSSIDVSKEALLVATENAKKNDVDINFIYADILDQTQWEALSQYDIIVSNPPYVTNTEKVLMQPNVLDHEPHIALFVPDHDPLIFYREIIALAKINLYKAGSLWFEINEMFADELRNMALNQGFKEVNIIFDFRGKSRFLQCLK
ncbi:MAG: peptide chain release factor N(5)-glutamine methyltransferase [Bacteroidales bacterium]|nr:peptide chain release factor N(5)-glutamine methyltransferase [Bacteroidales bacterium]